MKYVIEQICKYYEHFQVQINGEWYFVEPEKFIGLGD